MRSGLIDPDARSLPGAPARIFRARLHGRTRLAWLAALAMAAASTPAPAEAGETLEHLKSTLRARAKSTPYMMAAFEETREMPMLADPAISTGTLEFLAPDTFRKETRHPHASVTLGSPDGLQIHYPAFQRLEIYPLGSDSPATPAVKALTSALSLERIEETFDIELKPGSDGGIMLTLTPDSRKVARYVESLEIHFDGQANVVATILAAPDGSRTHTRYSGHRYGNPPVDAFHLDIPDGTTIVRPLDNP